jgi:aspartate racemase
MEMKDLRRSIAELSPEKRALFEERLMRIAAGSRVDLAIPRRGTLEPCPLSFAQQRLWFLDQLEPNSSAYNICKALRLTGALDVPALQKTLDAIVERHHALRTNFVAVEENPVQVVADARPVEMRIVSLSVLPPEQRGPEMQRLMEAESKRPFDLARDFKMRALLLELGDDEHTLFLTLHHIASDGWSVRILAQEMAEFYGAFSTGRAPVLPDLPIQYADYAVWQRQWMQGPVLESQLAYWRQRLANAPPLLDLPTDLPRPVVQTFHGAHQATVFPPRLAEGIKALSRAEGATPFMTLLAAFHTLLHRYTGQDDIVVGSPIAGRTRVETEGLISFFVNTLVMRGDLSGDPPFRELLRRVRDAALGAYAHQDVPFEKLVEDLHPSRDTSRSPLFQVMFVLQNTPPSAFTLPGLTATPIDVDPGTAKFDLSLYLDGRSEALSANLEYNTDLFLPATITRMLEHFRTLLEAIVADPGRRLSELPIMSEAERQQILVEWNDTRADYPRERCIHELFEAQAARTPEAVALASPAGSMTYLELDRRANQLARYLQSLGVGPETPVGICIERSPDMVVGLLGILKAGGAYLPLDPTLPAERLGFLLSDARPAVVVTRELLLGVLPSSQTRVACLDRDREAIAAMDASAPASGTSADGLAYVIYTSGSTGTPKGVQGLHRGAVNRFAWMWKAYPFTPRDVSCHKTSLSFVDSVWELFGPLLAGVKVVLIPDEVLLESSRLVETLAAHRVTRIVLVPSLLRTLLDAEPDLGRRLPDLEQWTCSGEGLSSDLADRFHKAMPQRTLLNIYGSSEVSADSTAYEVGTGLLPASVPIGRPIANTRIYLLDKFRQPVPIGVPGELHVGGDGLARGYLERPELTAEKFIPDPFGSEPGARLYRTGDVARYLPDGDLEYLGRVDHQVKVRGFRVELGEIEAVLGQHPAVRECVVATQRDGAAEPRIVAYVVPGDAGAPAAAELRDFMRQKLPGYMVPSGFVTLEHLPLTPTGKVDRLALPAHRQTGQDASRGFVGPRDAVEAQLIGVWEKVLGVHPIGIGDNFFDLGGHSLLGVRLFARMEKVFGRRLLLSTLFQAPTVEQMADVLRQGWSPPWTLLVPIRPSGSRTPFFVVPSHAGDSLDFGQLSRYLDPDQPLYGFQARGLDGKELPHDRIEEMAAAYLEEVRMIQPSSPYFLGGYCFGGKVAFEMARQLQAKGEDIAFLVLFDSYGPRYQATFPRGAMRRTLHRLAHGGLFALGRFWRMNGQERLAYVWSSATDGAHRAWSTVARRLGREADWNRTTRLLTQSVLMASRAWKPQTYPGRVLLFRATKEIGRYSHDPDMGWQGLAAGGLETHRIIAEQGRTIFEPAVQGCSRELQACLDRAHEAVAAR